MAKSKICNCGCGAEFVPTKLGQKQVSQSHYITWLINTPEGQKKQAEAKEKAKKIIAKAEKKKDKDQREKLKTLSDWNNDLQKEINLIVRLIDKNHPCISSNRNLGNSYDAGHLFGRQSNPHIRYHLFNIFAQSVHDNQHKSGNQLAFVDGIEKTFGVEIKNYCLSLKGLPILKLSILEIKDKIVICRRIVKWLKKEDRKFSIQERILLRIKFIEVIGLYENNVNFAV